MDYTEFSNTSYSCFLYNSQVHTMNKALKDIYFYNAKALANELRDGSVSEYRAVKHMIATVVLGGIGFEIPITADVANSESSFIHLLAFLLFFIITAIISYYGSWLTYQVNRKGDGKDYFMRFTALSLPVGIQLLVTFVWVGLALGALSAALISAFDGAGIIAMSILFYLAGMVFVALFFFRMRKYIAIAADVNE